MKKQLGLMRISGKDVLPLIEGGKGVAVSDGKSAGAWAKAGAVGTISGVLADIKDGFGNIMPKIYQAKNRLERQQEMILQSIRGAISQAKIAFEESKGEGRIHLNVMWEQGGCQQILDGVLKGAKGLIHGITCGAGMPFKLGEIASNNKVFYYPIVSSGRAFKALWSRAYKNFSEYLGGVVYEDPWKAGGHDGFSSSDSPDRPQSMYSKIKEIRSVLTEIGLGLIPIVVAGGVWTLTEFSDWVDNKELGPVAFQFGTRPVLTHESPVGYAWKDKLMSLDEGDVVINPFSPTGFLSSAVKNRFINKMYERLQTEISYTDEAVGEKNIEIAGGVFVSPEDKSRANEYVIKGLSQIMKTPDHTVVFVSEKDKAEMTADRVGCIGCISQCRFSSFTQYTDNGVTGKIPDPRSFCIQKGLVAISHGGSVEDNIMFSGSNGYKFKNDKLLNETLKNKGRLPTVAELIEDLKNSLA